MITPKSLRATVLASVAATALMFTGDARAVVMRTHPSACGGVQFSFLNSPEGQLKSGTGTTTYVCGVDTYTNNTFVTIDGWQNTTNGLKAATCFTAAGGNAGSCVALSGSGISGPSIVHFGVLTTAWSANPTGYKYLKVELGPIIAPNQHNTWFGFTHE